LPLMPAPPLIDIVQRIFLLASFLQLTFAVVFDGGLMPGGFAAPNAGDAKAAMATHANTASKAKLRWTRINSRLLLKLPTGLRGASYHTG
jgi:hypothetical protein